MRHSRVLAARVAGDPRLDAYDCDSDGHWVYTAPGWIDHEADQHVLHETTIAAVLSRLVRLRPCDCERCRSGGIR